MNSFVLHPAPPPVKAPVPAPALAPGFDTAAQLVLLCLLLGLYLNYLLYGWLRGRWPTVAKVYAALCAFSTVTALPGLPATVAQLRAQLNKV